MNVTKESAEFFKRLCVGNYDVGISKARPHFPALQEFLHAHNIYVSDTEDFAQFCRTVADRLEEKSK